MINKDLIAIFDYMERERGIKREIIVDAIEEALYTAVKKKLVTYNDISVNIDPKTASIEVTTPKLIVEHVNKPHHEISFEKAQEISPSCQMGELIDVIVTPKDFGRIAAQTAKNVINQKLRSAERDVIYEEYRHHINEIISGSVKSRYKGANLVVDLGKIDAYLPMENYPKNERYRTGDRIMALLLDVRENENGRTEIVLSRAHNEFVYQLFLQEVPELNDGTIVFKKIVRKPGYRTKIAVQSTNPKVDPVGACVGVRGNRIKNVILELHNEKIDVLNYSEDPIELLQGALDPIEIKKISINEEENSVSIIVNDEDIANVVGKGGMNAYLNGQLIGMQLDVQSSSDYSRVLTKERIILSNSEEAFLDEPLVIKNINKLIVENILDAGFDTYRKILKANPEELTKIPGVSDLEMANDILVQILQTACEMQAKQKEHEEE